MSSQSEIDAGREPARTMRQIASAVRQDTAGAGARHYSLELILAGESIYGPVVLSEAVKAATDNALEGLIGHLRRIEEKLVLAIDAGGPLERDDATATVDQLRSRISGWHFAKEALTPGEREILYVAEAVLAELDRRDDDGYAR